MDFSRYHANNCCPATYTAARAGNFQVNARCNGGADSTLLTTKYHPPLVHALIRRHRLPLT
jgi:hypothetical protein